MVFSCLDSLLFSTALPGLLQSLSMNSGICVGFTGLVTTSTDSGMPVHWRQVEEATIIERVTRKGQREETGEDLAGREQHIDLSSPWEHLPLIFGLATYCMGGYEQVVGLPVPLLFAKWNVNGKTWTQWVHSFNKYFRLCWTHWLVFLFLLFHLCAFSITIVLGVWQVHQIIYKSIIYFFESHFYEVVCFWLNNEDLNTALPWFDQHQDLLDDIIWHQTVLA